MEDIPAPHNNNKVSGACGSYLSVTITEELNILLLQAFLSGTLMPWLSKEAYQILLILFRMESKVEMERRLRIIYSEMALLMLHGDYCVFDNFLHGRWRFSKTYKLIQELEYILNLLN